MAFISILLKIIVFKPKIAICKFAFDLFRAVSFQTKRNASSTKLQIFKTYQKPFELYTEK